MSAHTGCTVLSSNLTSAVLTVTKLVWQKTVCTWTLFYLTTCITLHQDHCTRWQHNFYHNSSGLHILLQCTPVNIAFLLGHI